MNVVKSIAHWGEERGITEKDFDTNGYISNIVEELGELKESTMHGHWQGQVDALADIIVFSIVDLVKLQAKPHKVLQECLKEISSRTGAWSDEAEKWLKDTSPEAKAKWYTADYSNCRR